MARYGGKQTDGALIMGMLVDVTRIGKREADRMRKALIMGMLVVWWGLV